MKRVINTNMHIRILMALILLVFIMIFISFSIEINAGLKKGEVRQQDQNSYMYLDTE